MISHLNVQVNETRCSRVNWFLKLFHQQGHSHIRASNCIRCSYYFYQSTSPIIYEYLKAHISRYLLAPSCESYIRDYDDIALRTLSDIHPLVWSIEHVPCGRKDRLLISNIRNNIRWNASTFGKNQIQTVI